MRNLTKFQKIMILITIFWELFACNTNYNSYRNRFNFSDFLLMSSPVILYWSIIWVWGFDVFNKLFKILGSFIKDKFKINYEFIFYIFLMPIIVNFIVLLIISFWETVVCNKSKLSYPGDLTILIPMILYYISVSIWGFEGYNKLFKSIYNFIKNNLLKKIN